MTTIQCFNPIKIKFGTYFKKGLVLGPRHDDVCLSKVTTHVLKDSTFIGITINNEGRLEQWQRSHLITMPCSMYGL